MYRITSILIIFITVAANAKAQSSYFKKADTSFTDPERKIFWELCVHPLKQKTYGAFIRNMEQRPTHNPGAGAVENKFWQSVDSYYVHMVDISATNSKGEETFTAYAELIRSNDAIIYAAVWDSDWPDKKLLYCDGDTTALKKFFTHYASVWQLTPELNMFFRSNLVFAPGCGTTAQPEWTKMEAFVKERNFDALDLWMSDPCPEIQLIAMTGLYRLNQQGNKINDKERRLIQLIKNKKGKVTICDDGPSLMDIEALTKEIVFK